MMNTTSEGEEIDIHSETDLNESFDFLLDSTPSSESWTMPVTSEEIARLELGETRIVRQEALAELKNRLPEPTGEDNPPPTRFTDSFLLRFLRVSKFDVDKTLTKISNYIKMRNDYPQWFQGLDVVSNKRIHDLIHNGYVFVLPERDCSGRRVLVNLGSAVYKSPTDEFTQSDMMKAFMTTLETILEDPETQIRGLSYIFDCSGVGLRECSKYWTPTEASAMFTACEGNLPIRHMDMNIVDASWMLWAVIEFVKSFLSDKLKSRISVISDIKTNTSYNNKIHNKIPRDILPPELGGTSSQSLAEMTSGWAEKCRRTRHLLLDIEEDVTKFENTSSS